MNRCSFENYNCCYPSSNATTIKWEKFIIKMLLDDLKVLQRLMVGGQIMMSCSSTIKKSNGALNKLKNE